MRVHTLAILAIAWGTVGCIEQSDTEERYAWVRPNAVAAAFQFDADACEQAAAQRPRNASSNAAGYRADVRRIYMDCMTARGWEYKKVTGPNPANIIVDCKLPPNQIQRMSAKDCDNRYGVILEKAR